MMSKKQYQQAYQLLIRNKTIMAKIAKDLGLIAIRVQDGTYILE